MLQSDIIHPDNQRDSDNMTCIIGMHCDSGKTAVIIADSRAMIGGDYSRDRKIFKLSDDVLFASAGLSGIQEKLVSNVERTRHTSRRFLPSEVVNVFEDEMAELYGRYKMTRPYRFSTDEILLQGCIGFIDGGKPKLYCLHENGYAETIREFRALGHGERHAINILRTLYQPSITLSRGIEIGIYALVEVSKIDALVDDCPQVAVLETKDSKPSLDIWNVKTDTANGFGFQCDRTEEIKNKLNGIEEKRTKVFHLLLDGKDETKTKLDSALKEYEDGQPKLEE